MFITGVTAWCHVLFKKKKKCSGSDNKIRPCILLHLQELQQGMRILPWTKMCLPESISQLILHHLRTPNSANVNMSERKLWEHFALKKGANLQWQWQWKASDYWYIRSGIFLICLYWTIYSPYAFGSVSHKGHELEEKNSC